MPALSRVKVQAGRQDRVWIRTNQAKASHVRGFPPGSSEAQACTVFVSSTLFQLPSLTSRLGAPGWK